MNFLDRLFGNNQIEEINFSSIGTDMHSHFLPGIDDGAATMEDSMMLLRSMNELGYKKVITTPHIMSDHYRNTPEIILAKLEEVRNQIIKEGINIEIEAAAEYYLDFDFERKIKSEKLLTFGGNYLLFEISYLNAPESINKIIFEMQVAGYKPVLAHPERYPFWFSTFEVYEDLKTRGVSLQMNLNSLTGHYSSGTKKIAQKLIDNNLIDFVGTDCHHKGHIDLLKSLRHNPHLKKLIESGSLLNQGLP